MPRRFGGNTGKPNSFVGLDVANLTGGVYNAQTLTQGNNFACFADQILQEGIPNFVNPGIQSLAPVTNLINQYFGPIFGGLGCPQLANYSQALFNAKEYPGYKYSRKSDIWPSQCLCSPADTNATATGPDTNYKN